MSCYLKRLSECKTEEEFDACVRMANLIWWYYNG